MGGARGATQPRFEGGAPPFEAPGDDGGAGSAQAADGTEWSGGAIEDLAEERETNLVRRSGRTQPPASSDAEGSAAAQQRSPGYKKGKSKLPFVPDAGHSAWPDDPFDKKDD